MVGPRKSPARSPIVTQGKIDHAAVHLDEAVDHDLPVREVHARVHHHRIADAHLGDHHREAVRETRQHGNAERLQPRLGPVARLREKRVAHPHQPQRLREGIGAARGTRNARPDTTP